MVRRCLRELVRYDDARHGSRGGDAGNTVPGKNAASRHLKFGSINRESLKSVLRSRSLQRGASFRANNFCCTAKQGGISHRSVGRNSVISEGSPPHEGEFLHRKMRHLSLPKRSHSPMRRLENGRHDASVLWLKQDWLSKLYWHGPRIQDRRFLCITQVLVFITTVANAVAEALDNPHTEGGESIWSPTKQSRKEK